MSNYLPPAGNALALNFAGAYLPPNALLVPLNFGLTEAPDAFSFAPVSGVERGSTNISNTITISGIDEALPVSITGGVYSINGGPFISAAQYVNEGSTITLKAVASSNFATSVNALLTVGGFSAAFIVSTRAADTTPDAFSFDAVVNAQPSTIFLSNIVTIGGLEIPVTVSVAGGTYSLNGAAFTAASGSITNGDHLQLRGISSSASSGLVNVSVTVGTYNAAFAITTLAEDTTPDDFSFGTLTGALRGSTQTSGSVTISGINEPAPLSIVGGLYSLNGGAFTAANAVVNAGDMVRVQAVVSSAYSTTTLVDLDIGGVHGTFMVTSEALDTTPDNFSFPPISNAQFATLYTSNSIVVSGINAAAGISITGGKYSKNGAPFTADSGSVVSGDVIVAQVLSPSDYHETNTATITIGGVSAPFAVSSSLYAPQYKGPAAIVGIAVGEAAHLGAQCWLSVQPPKQVDPIVHLPLADADVADPQVQFAWGSFTRLDAQIAIDNRASMAQVDRQIVLPWMAIAAKDITRSLPWGSFSAADRGWTLPYLELHSRDIQREFVNDVPTLHNPQWWLRVPQPRVRNKQDRIAFARAVIPPWVHLPVLPYVPSSPDDHRCYAPPSGGNVQLQIGPGAALQYLVPQGDAVPINFKCNADRLFYIGRSLFVENVISVVRASDNLPLNVGAISMGIDKTSWAWTFTLAILDRASLLAIAPTDAGPQTVKITQNGHVWTSLIEAYTASSKFISSIYSVTGRSRTALLAAPYSAPRPYISTSPMNAQQLAARELGYSGFTLDWQALDWLVPAAAFSYDNETPLSAILRITNAIGATLQSHPSDDQLLVASGYPVSPWQWSDAGIEVAETIDANSVINLGITLQPGAAYRGIFTSGTNAGVLVRVIRDGTDGTPYATMVTDQLILTVESGTERGRIELANSDTQQAIKLVLPLLPDPEPPGLLAVGELLEIQDPVWGTYRAQVSAVSIDSTFQNGAWTIAQSVTIERHFT